jgi:hypothetical protein
MFLMAAVALAIAAPCASAASFTVISTEDTSEGVGCEGLLCPSIRAAITSARVSTEDDTIIVPPGNYQLVTGQLLIDTNVSIVGAGAGDSFIFANRELGGFRVVEVAQNTTASISKVSMMSGRALPRSASDNFYAGGIVKNSGVLALAEVRVSDGHGSSGGGIANTGGTMTIDRSLIDDNAADMGGSDGGGVLNFGGGTLTVRNSTIAANRAGVPVRSIPGARPKARPTAPRSIT